MGRTMSTVLKKGWVLRTSFKFKNDPRQFTLRIGLVLYQSDNPHRSSRLKYTKKTWFFRLFFTSNLSRIFWGLSWVIKPPLFSGKYIWEPFDAKKPHRKPLCFSEQWTFWVSFPKNDSLCNDLWRHRTWRHIQTGYTKWKILS